MSIKEWIQAVSLVAMAIALVVLACMGLWVIGVPLHLYLIFVMGLLTGGIMLTVFWSWFPQLLVDLEADLNEFQTALEKIKQRHEDELDRAYEEGFSAGYYAKELEIGEQEHHAAGGQDQ